MSEEEYIAMLDEYANEDTRALAKISLLEYLNSSNANINELKNSVNVLREQNAKLAMRITGTVEEVNEKSEEETFEENMEVKIKEFVDSI